MHKPPSGRDDAHAARPQRDPAEGERPEGAERVAKRIARAGLGSRRDAEAWIAAGRIAVNGVRLTTPATLVTPADRITVDGRVLPEPEPVRLFRYHKPAGLVTTAKDPEGRTTVFDRMPPGVPRVVSVGRLDLASEGLLLMTNDGALKRHLELPATGWIRRYRARAYGPIDQATLDRLQGGIEVEGVRYGPIQAAIEERTGANVWIVMSLAEGRNREVRRVLQALGLAVNRLIRTAYGPFQLGKLPRGAVEEVPRHVLRATLPAALLGDPPVADAARKR